MLSSRWVRILLFGSRRSHSFVPTRIVMRPARAVIPPRWARGTNGIADETHDSNGTADEMRDNAVAATDCLAETAVEPTRILTYCFLRFANLNKGAFKRLNRYEAALWRQAVQTMISLGKVRSRYPNLDALSLGIDRLRTRTSMRYPIRCPRPRQ
jgi:hypothetical protein